MTIQNHSLYLYSKIGTKPRRKRKEQHQRDISTSKKKNIPYNQTGNVGNYNQTDRYFVQHKIFLFSFISNDKQVLYMNFL